jgi:hypothetical protein
MPTYYGLPCDQFLFINDGHGIFTDGSAAWASAFKRLGMVTDAYWFNYDGDAHPDLIVVGEWMPVTIFKNNGKQLQPVAVAGLEKSEGWWNTIHAADLDGDGDEDFVLGNLGQNTKFKPTKESPLTLYVNDFDQNGSTEPIFAFERDGKTCTMALRQDIIKQMSSMKRKFVYYKDYAGKSVADIFDPRLLEAATTLHFYQPQSVVMMNDVQSTVHGPQSTVNADFRLLPLPVQAQVAPIYGIEHADVNGDGHTDLLLGGNLLAVKPEVGRMDALHGLVLTGDGKGNFTPLSSLQSGLNLEGEVRHVRKIRSKGKTHLAFVRNHEPVRFYALP